MPVHYVHQVMQQNNHLYAPSFIVLHGMTFKAMKKRRASREPSMDSPAGQEVAAEMAWIEG